MVLKKLFLIIVLLLLNCVLAQVPRDNINDSLSTKNFDYLSSGFSSNLNNPNKSNIYVKAWLKKAKAQKTNYCQLALVYKALIHNADKNMRLAYADSMINSAIHTKDVELIGSSYMTKGIVHYGRMEHIQALDNYLIADKYIAETNNAYLIHKLKYGIAQTKYYLGFYDEAISLLRECIDYFKEENDRAYLNSLHSLGLCYNHLGNYEWCTITNHMGIDEGKQLNDTSMEFYFIHSEGINECEKGRYESAIKKLTIALPSIINLKDFANESVAYFYMGKSYWSLNQREKAIIYFKKVDEIFVRENYIRPDLRGGYETLINYYKNQDDTKSELLYINQLLKVDQILAQNYSYLLRKVVKEYDTKELIKSKLEIETVMKFRTFIGFIIIITMSFLMLYLLRKNSKDKKRFEELMKRDNTEHPVTTNKDNVQNEYIDSVDIKGSEEENDFIKTCKQQSQDISPDIEATILKNLTKFEVNKKYLEKDMTLVKMAIILQTNSKYVSKVISKHRGKGTIEYITDLKIDYIIECLKKESRFRNYTNKALAEEAGFNSTQNFSKAFKTRAEISPTYFIYKLKKSLNAENSQ